MLNIFGTINWWNRQAFQESSKKIIISRIYTHTHSAQVYTSTPEAQLRTVKRTVTQN